MAEVELMFEGGVGAGAGFSFRVRKGCVPFDRELRTGRESEGGGKLEELPLVWWDVRARGVVGS